MSLINYHIISLTLCAFLLSACNSMNLNVDKPKNTVQASDNVGLQNKTVPESVYHPLKSSQLSQEITEAYQLAKTSYDQGDYQQTIDSLENSVLFTSSSIQLEAYILAALSAANLDQSNESFKYLKEAELLSVARHPDNQSTIKETRATILEYFGNWSEVVNIRMDLAYSLPLGQGEGNQSKLWLAVQNLTQNEEDAFYQQNRPLLNDWLIISDILRDQSLSIEQQLNTFERWQQDNPDHPAALSPPQDFQIMSSLSEMAPKKIVLMLPMSGNLGRASQAITDGFFASFYNQKQTRPQVHIINIDDYTDIKDALDYANKSQPDVIIGPLQKSNVAQLSHLNLPYPIIALNQLDITQYSHNLFHFSLSAEDEIHELITFAKQKGAINAAILSTQDTWALKQSDEFRSAAEVENVNITSNQAYADTPKGRQDAIQKLLLVNESYSRKNLIEKWTQEKVESISRSREDLDYIYYIGQLNDAKQIRPLLDFYFAEKVPMLASSTLNNSAPEKSTNPSDIERIIFTEISALTPKSRTLDVLSKNQSSNILHRLQALGADAYLLANKYQLFTLLPSTRISANTGIITIDKNGIFHKRPEVMTYRKGNLVYATSNQFFQQEETEE